MPARIQLLLLTLAAALQLLACASCPYDQRCNGNKLESCELGVDQMFGDPSYTTQDCEDPNAVCVETGARTAQCVMSAEAKCGPASADRCSADGLAVTCSDGYEVATDCAPDGNECLIVDLRARCAVLPATSCDQDSYDNSCEDDYHLLYCQNGLVTRKHCSVSSPGKCEPHQPKDQYEQTAYCRDTSTRAADAGSNGN